MIVNLNPGDRIEYTRRLDRAKTRDYKGVVIQVTDNHITVDLGKYKDSFQICDIGKSIIITFPEIELPKKEDEEVQKQDLSQVTTEQLKLLWEEGNHRKDYVRQKLGTNWYTAVNLLIQHGIIEASDDEEPFKGVYPIMKNGHIDWRTMWPEIQAELDKGIPRAEIADKFNVPHESLADMIRKERGKQKVKEKIEKTKESKQQETQETQTTPDPTAHFSDHSHEDKSSEFQGLMVAPEQLQRVKDSLLSQVKQIEMEMQLVNLCLYWYDQGRKDAYAV